MRLRRLAIIGSTLLLTLSACGDDKTDPGTTGTPDPAANKADCPDCDPAGPSAFEQTGVGDGFYSTASSWQVAFTFRGQPFQEKHEDFFLGGDAGINSEAFLFDYRVVGLDRDVFDNVQRDVATIEITQASAGGDNGQLFAQDRLDTYEHKLVFEMNDLLDPVSETLFNRDYPNGLRIELDSKSSLSGSASVFPRTIPRLLVNGGIDAPAPDLPADLRDIVDATDPAWSGRTYIKYVFDNGDVVYWSRGAGQLWPFYVETAQGAGVLTSWR